MPDIITMGELLIDFIPEQVDCSLKDVKSYSRAPGGAPANVAVGLSRLGVSCGFIGKVGNDPFGDYLRGVLKTETVDTSYLLTTDKAMTTLAFVSLTGEGERDFAFYRNPGADTLIMTEEIDLNYFTHCSVFHFGSISLIKDPARRTTIDLIEYARNKGILITFDPNIRQPLWGTNDKAVQEIKRILPLVDIIKLSGEELRTLIGEDINLLNKNQISKACCQLSNTGPGLVIVTLGSEGSFYYTDTDFQFVKGLKANCIDSTGAGDGFMAAFLEKLINLKLDNLHAIKQGNLHNIISFANKIGALVTTKKGAIPSMPFVESLT